MTPFESGRVFKRRVVTNYVWSSQVDSATFQPFSASSITVMLDIFYVSRQTTFSVTRVDKPPQILVDLALCLQLLSKVYNDTF